MRRCISAHTVLRMKWGLFGLSVLCVVTGSSCGGSKAPQPSGTVATSPPRTVVVTTVPVTSTSTLAAATTSTSVVLGPGPSDAEIQAIIDDTDRRTAEIFGAFKKTLVITPEIERMIVDSFGPGADDIRESLLSHVDDGGRNIRDHPNSPVSKVIKIISRSSECILVRVQVDLSPMLDHRPGVTNQLFLSLDSRWYLLQEIGNDDANPQLGKPCDLA